MIVMLEGILMEKKIETCIIMCHGVGYSVLISSKTYDQLPATGHQVRLLIYHEIKEQSWRLIGFFAPEEKHMFEILIQINGIGAKVGLAILSQFKAKQLVEITLQEDFKTLTTTPGIGKKTAERIIFELKNKLGDSILGFVSASDTIERSYETDILDALAGLGFDRLQARQAVLETSGETMEIHLKNALKLLAGKS